MRRVIERLDAEAIARGDELAIPRVPDREGELTTQRVDGACAPVFVEMERNLAVRPRPEVVTVALEVAANPLEVVELAVGDESQRARFVGDRLIAGLEVDDAQACVAEAGTPVGRDPDVLGVRSPMPQPADGPAHVLRPDHGVLRDRCHDSAHAPTSLLRVRLKSRTLRRLSLVRVRLKPDTTAAVRVRLNEAGHYGDLTRPSHRAP